MEYLTLSIAILLAGIIPAFGPPSWIFAVFFYQNYHLNPVYVVLITAFATALGRLILAFLTRLVKRYIPKKYLARLDESQKILKQKKEKFRLVIGLFIISPLPSAQLFEAAGLMNIRLIPLAVAFFFGRLFSLSFYLAVSHIAIKSVNDLWSTGVTSPWAIAAELLTILCLVALFNLKWVLKKAKMAITRLKGAS